MQMNEKKTNPQPRALQERVLQVELAIAAPVGQTAPCRAYYLLPAKPGLTKTTPVTV